MQSAIYERKNAECQEYSSDASIGTGHNVTYMVGYMEMSYDGMTIARGMVKLYTPLPCPLGPTIMLTPTGALTRAGVSTTQTGKRMQP
ncbi:hypothetical protein DIS24_g8510 [Lasiodiplodia hormozganensis]|uniref:Uncharacterized protein n=1 Tax=Lasiodiplodia hormozganensis TaxID=869390 RepID=A0AA40CMW4_9PEZI|nr:hypothetical protein DIS24_g8510 [Lasiodiplodia hormozganensis]